MNKKTYAGATIAVLSILFFASPIVSAQGTTWFNVEIVAPGETCTLRPRSSCRPLQGAGDDSDLLYSFSTGLLGIAVPVRANTQPTTEYRR